MAQINPDRSIAGILTEVFSQFATLVRTESELARTELSEKFSQVGAALALIVAGAVLLMPALVILLEAGVTALEETGLESYWSALAVGGGVLLVGLLLLMLGVNRLKVRRLLPDKTLTQLQEDASAARRQTRREHAYQRAA
jgi:uncharacterized membrane protein YqgA involved in biofilm formation